MGIWGVFKFWYVQKVSKYDPKPRIKNGPKASMSTLETRILNTPLAAKNGQNGQNVTIICEMMVKTVLVFQKLNLKIWSDPNTLDDFWGQKS